MSDATENAEHFPSNVRNAKHSVVANEYTRNIRERSKRIYEELPKAVPKYRQKRFRSNNSTETSSVAEYTLARLPYKHSLVGIRNYHKSPLLFFEFFISFLVTHRYTFSAIFNASLYSSSPTDSLSPGYLIFTA